MRALSHEQARRVYDRIGRRQETQAFYEDRATDVLIEAGGFESAGHVFEFGCGTGRLAERLLAQHLTASATYRGIDISPKMVSLASRRVARFGPRAEVQLSVGGPLTHERSEGYDRWVSTFVFDLLSGEEIDQVLADAHRMLARGGRLCLAGLTNGVGPCSRAVARLLALAHRLNPVVVGGCRALELRSHLQTSAWRVLAHAKLTPYCIPLEAVVVERC
jgi:ubiquinone/menaquinone biosynthesis C-methylase UbiE